MSGVCGSNRKVLKALVADEESLSLPRLRQLLVLLRLQLQRLLPRLLRDLPLLPLRKMRSRRVTPIRRSSGRFSCPSSRSLRFLRRPWWLGKETTGATAGGAGGIGGGRRRIGDVRGGRGSFGLRMCGESGGSEWRGESGMWRNGCRRGCDGSGVDGHG